MSVRQDLHLHHFFATVATPCPYLAGRMEQKLVVDLAAVPDGDLLFRSLSRAGFRRSHSLAYRPACKSCQACVPVRIDAGTFMPTRSLRRVARKTADLEGSWKPPLATREQFALFHRYQNARHGSSDMARMLWDDYRAMVEDTPVETAVLELRDPQTGRLMAACLTDDCGDGLSAVYSLFEPDAPQLSLGTAVILRLIEHARSVGKRFVYLGYWIAGSDTMDYKRRFPDVEALAAEGWMPLAASAPSGSDTH